VRARELAQALGADRERAALRHEIALALRRDARVREEEREHVAHDLAAGDEPDGRQAGTPSWKISVASGIEPGDMPPMSAWCARFATYANGRRRAPRKTGATSVTSGQVCPAGERVVHDRDVARPHRHGVEHGAHRRASSSRDARGCAPPAPRGRRARRTARTSSRVAP
jgi:hypothetical protein